jgi:hypothetical protein
MQVYGSFCVSGRALIANVIGNRFVTESCHKGWRACGKRHGKIRR